MESIAAHVLALPEAAAWPEMASLFDRPEGQPHPDWNLPVLACRVVGSDPAAAMAGAAAIACMQVSIILVDDMLDDDPRGEYRRLGNGPTANLALALQAAAFRLIEGAAVEAERRIRAIASLASMALTTALGQKWDIQNLAGEENYWKVVRTKSTPFYGAALHVGALLGGANAQTAEGLREFGVLIGEIIQVHDDLIDAFQTPANPDWKEGRNNLPILYARTANHADRVRFAELQSRSGEPQALREAQQILIRCGAVSYCVYHLIKRYQAASQLLGSLSLADPAPLAEILAHQTQPLAELLRKNGAEIPGELLHEPLG